MSHGWVLVSVDPVSVNENRALVERIFERMAAGETRALSDAMAPEFRWIFPGRWSWAGSWGPKSVVVHDLLRPLMAQFTEYRIRAEAIHADGDRVVVQARSTATTVGGECYDQHYCFVFRVAAGRLIDVIEYCDTALVERVLEPLR